MQRDVEGAMLDDARAQLEAAHQAAAAAAAALEAARRDPVEEQRKQNASLARAFKAEHFSGAGAIQLSEPLSAVCNVWCSGVLQCLSVCTVNHLDLQSGIPWLAWLAHALHPDAYPF
jgi:hypothetical protein